MGTENSNADLQKDLDEFNRNYKLSCEQNDKREAEMKKYGEVLSETKETLEKIAKRQNELDAKYQRVSQAEEGKKVLDDSGKLDLKSAFYNHYGRWGRLTEAEVEAWSKLPSPILPNESCRATLPPELRGLNETKVMAFSSDPTGGYLATPPEVDQEILKNVIEFSPIRAHATVRSITASEWRQRRRTGQFAAVRVAEIGTRAETTGLTWGMETIHTMEMYAQVNWSRQNIEDVAYNLEAITNEEASEQFGLKEGTDFISGNGVDGLPEGLLTNGDVSYTFSGHTTELKADATKKIIWETKEPYLANAKYFMNRLTMGVVDLFKDGEGRYLLKPLTDKPGWTLNGFPVIGCTDLASPTSGITFSASVYPILFGDMRKAYKIIDRIGITTLRDPYTAASTGTIILHMWLRNGGGVVMPEAIRKLKVATS